MNRDEEHLKTLSTCYYVLAGINALFACIPIIHLVIGISILTDGFGGDSGGPPQFFGIIFVVIALVSIVFGWTMAICQFFVAKFIAARNHYTFCFVLSVVSCLNMPLGTILGIFTILTLNRDSIKELFEVNKKSVV